MTDALTRLEDAVEAGQLVALTVNGVVRHYRARASGVLGDLRLCDLQADPASDANACMARALAQVQE